MKLHTTRYCYNKTYIVCLSEVTVVRERGSAPKRGRHSTIFSPPKCVCAVAAGWSDNPHQQVVPRSRIPRTTSHFSYFGRGDLSVCPLGGFTGAHESFTSNRRGVPRGSRQGQALRALLLGGTSVPH